MERPSDGKLENPGTRLFAGFCRLFQIAAGPSIGRQNRHEKGTRAA